MLTGQKCYCSKLFTDEKCLLVTNVNWANMLTGPKW